jgi:para-nitrobenzyl esterase
MVDYWASFATTGQPRAAQSPAWPAYGAGGALMVFQDVPKPTRNLLPGMYELQEAVVCRRRAAGTQPWNWNVGLASPPLPPRAPGCG